MQFVHVNHFSAWIEITSLDYNSRMSFSQLLQTELFLTVIILVVSILSFTRKKLTEFQDPEFYIEIRYCRVGRRKKERMLA